VTQRRKTTARKKPTARKKTTAARATARIELERRNFSSLLAANPNYFGNYPDLGLEPQKKLAANTKYEALTCVSFSPERDLLQGTIDVKLPFGYGGGLCATGSNEYVRFYVDYGGGWEDAGTVGVKVHDIPAANDCEGDARHPISYVAGLPYDPRRKWCFWPVLPRVRAILSWQVVPPAGQPDWQPVWGNVLECNVQIKPRSFKIGDLFEYLKPKLPADLELPDVFKEIIDISEPVPPTPPPPPLSVKQLAELYGRAKKKDVVEVEPARFGFHDLHAAVGGPAATPETAYEKLTMWKSIGLDWSAALAGLEETAGNTNYEELGCVGLDNNSDALVGTFRVKLPSGFSGPPCSAGSVEYVAFWVDWDDSCEWTYAGTVQVNVHDFNPLPDGGLCYAAVLPVDLSQVRKHCTTPVIGRVRAVLSWNTAPSPSDPDVIPHWGNRVDVHVQVKPGPAIDPTDPTPLISILGGVETGMIHDVTGLTTPGAVFADNGLHTDWIAPHSRACPFAGIVTVKGPSFPGYKYRILVRQLGGSWAPLTTSFRTVNLFGIGTDRFPDPVTGWTDYLPWFANISGMLGRWFSSEDNLWEVAIQIQGVPGMDVHRIQLDNTLPEPNQVDLQISGGNCGKFNVGDVISGTFKSRDTYFAQFRISTTPFAAPPGALVPSQSTVQTPPGGDTWSLDTSAMQACGYVILLATYDRAIVNSASTGRHTDVARGFCLEE
jgi:hypothetical protein